MGSQWQPPPIPVLQTEPIWMEDVAHGLWFEAIVAYEQPAADAVFHASLVRNNNCLSTSNASAIWN